MLEQDLSPDRGRHVEAEARPQKHRLRRQPHAERSSTRARTRRRKTRRRRARARRGGRRWRARAGWTGPRGRRSAPRSKPACSISHAADSLTRPSGSGHHGIDESLPVRILIRAKLIGRDDRIDEERPAAPVVGIACVQHHRLRAPDVEDAPANIGQRRGAEPPACQVLHDIRVAKGRRATADQAISDGEHDVAVPASALLKTLSR